MSARPIRRARVDALDQDRGVFMISVAAELAGMHPQTLRMYESRGLITPKRSPKGTRLYSQQDVDRLRRFQLEAQLERMGRRLEALEQLSDELRTQMAAEIESVRRSFRAELVRYEAPGTALVPVRIRRR